MALRRNHLPDRQIDDHWLSLTCSQFRKCRAFTMIWGAHPVPGRAAPMTTRTHRTQEEYEVQVRDLLRVVSACTLGLCSFAAGLLIGSFVLF